MFQRYLLSLASSSSSHQPRSNKKKIDSKSHDHGTALSRSCSVPIDSKSSTEPPKNWLFGMSASAGHHSKKSATFFSRLNKTASRVTLPRDRDLSRRSRLSHTLQRQSWQLPATSTGSQPRSDRPRRQSTSRLRQ